MKNFIGAFLLFVVMAYATQSTAGSKWRIGATLTSFHFIDVPENVSEFNNDHRGLQLEYMLTENFYVLAGEYRNSFYKKCEVISQCDEISLYAGAGHIFYEREHVRVAYEGALVSGYEGAEYPKLWGDISPIAGIAVSREIFDNHALKFLFNVPGVIALQYQYGFNR